MASAKDVDIRQVSFGSRMSASFSKGQLFHLQQRGLQAVGAVRAPDKLQEWERQETGQEWP